MDFTFDLNQMNVIGHKKLELPNPDLSGDKDRGSEKSGLCNANNCSALWEGSGYISSWSKPQLSQVQKMGLESTR